MSPTSIVSSHSQVTNSAQSPEAVMSADQKANGDSTSGSIPIPMQQPSESPSTLPAPPPNGGTIAWLQVLGSFLLFFSSWGMVNTYGIFQTYYATHYLSNKSASDIAWIGTMQGFLLIAIGILSGPLYDLGYLRLLVITGTILTVAGLMLTSIARQYYSIFLSLGLRLTLGVCFGVGAGCLFVPSVAIVATYFTTKRAVATGITAAGGSVGGVIFPILFRTLLNRVGFGWACRVLAFIILACLCVALAVLKPRSITGKRRTLIDLSAFRDPAFDFFSISLFCTFIGLYAPFFYISLYAEQKLHTSQTLAFYFLPILNSGSIFGRIIPNIAAGYWGSITILVYCIMVSAFLLFIWIAVSSVGGLVAFAIFYGFFSGAAVSLPPTALMALCPDLSVAGARIGMSFTFAGFGLLIGNPIAGIILKGNSGFKGLQAFSGATILAGFFSMCLAIFFHQRNVKKTTQGEAVEMEVAGSK